MPYATAADLSAEFKGVTFGASTSPTDTQVASFITQAEAEINGRVGLVYEVPIVSAASPNSFALMQSLSIDIVYTRIKSILEVKTADDTTSQNKGGTTRADNARKILEQIVAQKLGLFDATKRDTKDGVRSFTSENSEPLVFQKDTVQW